MQDFWDSGVEWSRQGCKQTALRDFTVKEAAEFYIRRSKLPVTTSDDFAWEACVTLAVSGTSSNPQSMAKDIKDNWPKTPTLNICAKERWDVEDTRTANMPLSKGGYLRHHLATKAVQEKFMKPHYISSSECCFAVAIDMGRNVRGTVVREACKGANIRNERAS